MTIVKIYNSRKFTFWSRHKTKTNATMSANKVRKDGYLFRIHKNTNRLKTKKERSHPWEVYIRRKQRTGPLFSMRRRTK